MPRDLPPGVARSSTSTKAVQQLCQPTDYKQTCETALTSAAVNTSDPKQLIQLAFNVTVSHIGEAIKNSSLLQKVMLLYCGNNIIQKLFTPQKKIIPKLFTQTKIIPKFLYRIFKIMWQYNCQIKVYTENST